MKRSELKPKHAYTIPAEFYAENSLINLLEDGDMLITNINPDNLNLGGKNIEVYWITSTLENKRYKTLSPTELPDILKALNDYNFKKGGVIAINCLETLILFNGFENVIKFLFSLYGEIQNKEIAMIIHMDKRAFTERDYRYLLRTAVIEEL